jgi:hypothetical protein
MKLERRNLKERITKGVRTYLICVLISAMIFFVVIVERAYQDLLEGKANAYTLMASILFIGFLIFLIVEISPIFGRLLFRMFGAEKETLREERS